MVYTVILYIVLFMSSGNANGYFKYALCSKDTGEWNLMVVERVT